MSRNLDEGQRQRVIDVLESINAKLGEAYDQLEQAVKDEYAYLEKSRDRSTEKWKEIHGRKQQAVEDYQYRKAQKEGFMAYAAAVDWEPENEDLYGPWSVSFCTDIK